MDSARTLTPTLSRKREREQSPVPQERRSAGADDSLFRKREREQADVPDDSLSRLRERARVRARELRGASTDAELLLWSKLRNRQLAGLKFRRQRQIGPYFADFACLEVGLVIELDGGQHQLAAGYDAQRERAMQALGFTTLRFWDNDVLNEPDAVLERISAIAETLTPTLSRKRERERTADQECR